MLQSSKHLIEGEKANNTANHDSTKRWFIFTLSIWAIAIFLGGYYGFFATIPPTCILPIVVSGIMTPVLFYYFNESFRSYVVSIGLKYLTLFNVWRIPAGLVFLYYGSRNLLPEQFVHNAAYGDLTVGLLVPIILMIRGGIGKYLVFHIFGLLDFVVAVGTGLTLTLLQVPLMENIRTFPILLIPLYGVCITGALHIMTLDILLRRSKAIKQSS
jgi:hypothetical protein